MIIPAPVAAVAAEVLAEAYSWTSLELQFLQAGAPTTPPDGPSKAARALAWLRRIDDECPDDALTILGKLLHRFMEDIMPGEESWSSNLGALTNHPADARNQKRRRLHMALAQAGLAYVRGGTITRGGIHVGARQLGNLIKGRNLAAIEAEFERLAERASAHPRDALSAAANIVESVLGEIIAAWELTPPANRTLSTLWTTLKPALNADPAALPDPDLKKIVGAMAAMVDGLQGLRDDKSRAHAMRPELARSYKIEPRHARLAINAALAFTVFLIEAWDARDKNRA